MESGGFAPAGPVDPSDQLPPSAVLFDLDGTLLDTEPWWFDAEVDYTQRFGAQWTVEDAAQVVGTPLENTAAALRERTGSDDTDEEIIEFLTDYLLERFATEPTPWRPGMAELTGRLRESGLPLAVVTSSPGPIARAAVAVMPGGLFDAVVSGTDVANLKPDPEPYVQAARELGIAKERAVAIEDSGSGVAAAVAAGVNTVFIPCQVQVPASPEVSRLESAHQLTDQVLARISRGQVFDLIP